MNILSTANNHALDYSYDGLERTLHYLEQAEFPFSGTGRNLADASRNVWTVYVFLVWYKEYFEEITATEIKEDAIAEVEKIVKDLSKEEIINFIENENFNSLSYLKQDYFNFKKYINEFNKQIESFQC